MLFSIFFWALLIFIFERLVLKNRKFKSIAQGDPVLLINDGQVNSEIMDKNNMDLDDVRMLLRMKDVFSLSEVKYAVLEESGQLSVMQYAREEPPKRDEVMEDYKENVLSELLIDSGKIENDRLEKIGVDEEWLRKQLKEETGEDLENIYFAEWDENNGFFVQKNEK